MSMAFRRFCEDEGVKPTLANAREFSRVHCDPAKSRTKQADGPGTDINFIVNQYARSGVLPTMMPPQFGDATMFTSIQDALSLMSEAGAYFASLPSKVRERFKNDPALFVMAANDPAATPVFVELGLMPAPKEEPGAAGASGSGTGGT